ncbi:MAG: Rho termination factor N-terminal domain-containing protein [Bacteroidales bacterium]
MYDILELSNKLLPELRSIAKELKIKRTESLKKQDLIYKILDQQAIEATENKKTLTTENKDMPVSNESRIPEWEQGQRRGKRPRTFKQGPSRSVESVMSVSPDDLKKPETVAPEQKETVAEPEKKEEKADQFRSS